MTQTPMDRLFESIFERMLKAGWLHSFTFTKNKGWHLTWNTDGGLIAMEINSWIKALGLDTTDERPLMAYEFAHGRSPHPTSNSETVNGFLKRLVSAGFAHHAAFTNGICEIAWTPAGVVFCDKFVAYVADLGIGADEDLLLTLVHAISGWVPDETTEFRFG